jgi:hypothetical protein
MKPQELLHVLRSHPTQIEFQAVIACIDEHYDFSPTAFVNGELRSEAGQNSGSCKVLSFAKLHDLSDQETLALFGAYYRVDVLENPAGTDHGNIRNLMVSGLVGVHFEGQALQAKP